MSALLFCVGAAYGAGVWLFGCMAFALLATSRCSFLTAALAALAVIAWPIALPALLLWAKTRGQI